MTGYPEISLVRGMRYLADAQAAIANNLANVDTQNFKRRAFHAAPAQDRFESELQQALPTVVYREDVDWQPGTARETGNRFNVSIDGPGFFRVQGDDGRAYYTRDGEMRLDQQGRLCTREGRRYLDANQAPITLTDSDGGSPGDIAISPGGMIADPRSGQNWGPIGLFKAADRNSLQALGNGLYADTGRQQPQAAATSSLQQGFIEGSNIDSLQELVQMILVQRTFGATQKALTSVGQMQTNLIENMR
jgi:flagellar basal body rod protein FlgG